MVNYRWTFSLQFEKVDKEPYYTALKHSFNELVKNMPVDNCEKLKRKFKEIKTEFGDVSEIKKTRSINYYDLYTSDFICKTFCFDMYLWENGVWFLHTH